MRPQAVLPLAVLATALAIEAEIWLHPVVPNEFGWLVLTAAVACSCAMGAAVYSLRGRSRSAGMLLGAAFLWPVGDIGWAWQSTTTAWIVPWVLQGASLPILIGLLLADPEASRPSRVVRAALIVWIARAVLRALAYDPDAWQWCRCARYPPAPFASEAGFLLVDRALQVADAAVMVGLAIALIQAFRAAPGADRPGRVPVLASGLALAAASIFSDVLRVGDVNGWLGGGPVYLRLAAFAAVPQALLLGDSVLRWARQLRAAQTRLVVEGDEVRRRFERDLHDGAQQLLVAAAFSLEEASAAVGEPTGALLQRASDQVTEAQEEIRRLAAGISPVTSVEDLEPVLTAMALRSPVATAFHLHRGTAPDLVIARTVYFAVAEAVTNAVKHACATAIDVRVELGDPVRIRVSDDGVGGADPDGVGLRGIRDRVRAVGGRMAVHPGRQKGTVVEVALPSAPR